MEKTPYIEGDLCKFDHNFDKSVIAEDENKRYIYLNACRDLIYFINNKSLAKITENKFHVI